jgi:hypothetical protein
MSDYFSPGRLQQPAACHGLLPALLCCGSGLFIPDPDPNIFVIPDLDPGSYIKREVQVFFFIFLTSE